MKENIEVNKNGYRKTKYDITFIGSSRHYYLRPTHQYILYEEDVFNKHQSFSGGHIFCWNF